MLQYHGGSNFGRYGGGPFITTSYDYDAPLDEYGLINEPKWGHLKALHQALKLCEPGLIAKAPYSITLGPQQDASVFSNGTDNCVAFLSNLNTRKDSTVEFNGSLYHLPPKSISILPDCRTVAFNTAKVSAQTNTLQMSRAMSASLEMAFGQQPSSDLQNLQWEWYREPLGAWGETHVTSECCLEQIHATKDESDYLWYITSVDIPEFEDIGETVLNIASICHAAALFVNGQHIVSVAGSKDNPCVEVDHPIPLQRGRNELAILSTTIGLQSSVRVGRIQDAGIRGPIMLKGLLEGALHLSSQTWTHQVGLQGEALELFSPNATSNVEWMSSSSPPQNQSLLWYKIVFDAPASNLPLALDLITMGKGQAWVNGNSIGRYWPSYQTSAKNCSSSCGPNSRRCYGGCGESSQRWYHVPLSWLNPTGNLLVLFEEDGGDPTGIAVVARSTAVICSSISEDYPAPLDLWQPNGTSPVLPEMRLECLAGQEISSIIFASFGTPRGSCNKFRKGPCHSRNSATIAKQICVGKNSCTIQVTSATFGTDPCSNQTKALSIVAACSARSASTR